MERSWCIVAGVLFLFCVQIIHAVAAKKANSEEDVIKTICIPKRTVIKMRSSQASFLRTHTNFFVETGADCQVCVCSVSGDGEFCFKRPARNVNECIRATAIEANRNNTVFDHSRSIFQRIRRVGSDDDNLECVPFVSEYTDCTEANICTGCRKCTCNAEGGWDCNHVTECPIVEKQLDKHPQIVENALDMLKSVIASGKPVNIKPALIKEGKHNNNLLFVDNDIDRKLLSLINRRKRGVLDVTTDDYNGTIAYFNTVDDINEDILKNSNDTGTISAQKIHPNMPKGTRRLDDSTNATQSNNLNTKSNRPLDHNIIDNTIDITNNKDHKLIKEKANISINERDKAISKIIAKEMKRGEERIGDKDAPVISKISFTPENDTITAMAYIAGNLLNKLWYMENDSEESTEIEKIKHEKIADLLDLFKAPLTIRQETFLRNALEKLSEAIVDNEKKGKGIDTTLCDKLKNEMTNLKSNESKMNDELERGKLSNRKMTNILDLLNEFKTVKKTLDYIEKEITTKSNSTVAKDHQLFGNILEKITKLLSPDHKHKSTSKNIRKLNLFRKNLYLHPKIRETFHLDPSELNLSIKDKILADYLNAMEEQPDCLLGKLLNRKNLDFSNADVEQNILLNLSEFYKIKSYADLIKLLNPKVENVTNATQSKRSNINITDSLNNNTNAITEKGVTEPVNKTNNVKEMLKQHLKELLSDLKQLKEHAGVHANDNFDISEVLPCLANFLKADPQNVRINSKDVQTPAGKLLKTLNDLKLDLESPQTRRLQISDDNAEDIPKSLIVWDRMIKNMDVAAIKASGRRSIDLEPPKDLDKTIESLMNINQTFRSYSNLTNTIQPSERMILLKTILADVKQYINTIQDIRPIIVENTISDSKRNILNKLLEHTKHNMHEREIILSKITPNDSITNFNKEIKQHEHAKGHYTENNINRMIKERVEAILRGMEGEGDSKSLKYKIARRIITNIEKGEHLIARELFKILVADHTNVSTTNSGAKLDADQVEPKELHLGSEQSKHKWDSDEAHILKKLINGTETV